ARAEPNPLTTNGLPIAHARLAHGHRSDAGHDLALGQLPVAPHALGARLGLEIGISPQEVSDFRLDGLREQGTCPVSQNLSERIGKSPWLSQLDDVSVGHGVSLLWWRSGGVEHPHDTPPYPFMPSPTSAHSSLARLEKRAQAYIERSRRVNAEIHESVRQVAFVTIANLVLIVLYGDPKIDEPLLYAWDRVRKSAAWQECRKHHPDFAEYGREDQGDFCEPGCNDQTDFAEGECADQKRFSEYRGTEYFDKLSGMYIATPF